MGAKQNNRTTGEKKKKKTISGGLCLSRTSLWEVSAAPPFSLCPFFGKPWKQKQVTLELCITLNDINFNKGTDNK